MTTREMIDSFSETLLRDERILSLSERELLANVLQRARTCAGSGDTSVPEAIERAVGETLAHRAFAILGNRIVEKIVEQQPASGGEESHPWVEAHGPRPPSPGPPSPGTPTKPPATGPRPPSPGPPSPGISAGTAESSARGATAARIQAHGPRPPSPGPPSPATPTKPPATGPRPPSPGPPSPGVSARTAPTPPLEATPAWQAEAGGIAVMDASEILPAQCVVLDEFLAPQELDALTQYVLARETEFQLSEVVSPGVSGGGIDYEYRRSRVLLDLGPHQDVIVNRIQGSLPRFLERLGHDRFPISRWEVQITASNDGDYFRWHSDNGQEEVASREITFVYFFHREPKTFRGGDLRIYDSRWENGRYEPTENYRNIVPRQNQMVFFVSSLAHEITPVECPSGAFADSRFTVNGWIHR